MYIKLMGSLFLLGSASAIGFLKAEDLKVRVRKLLELKRMIGFLQGELRFHKVTLSEAFEQVSGRMEEPFDGFLKELAEKLENKDQRNLMELWQEAVEKLLKNEGFQKEDKYLLDLLGKGLGYLDLRMQTENLQLALIQAEEAVIAAKETQKVKGRLYQTMGMTTGVFLILLII